MGGIVFSCMLQCSQAIALATCLCISSILSTSSTQVAQLGHLAIVVCVLLLGFSMSQFLSDFQKQQGDSSGLGMPMIKQYVWQFFKAHTPILSDCDSLANLQDFDFSTCVLKQLIFRASLSLFICFGLFAIVTAWLTTSCFFKLWIPKSILVIVCYALTICFVSSSGEFLHVWTIFSFVLALLWLFVQSLVVLDFSFDIHTLFISKIDQIENSNSSDRLSKIYLFGLKSTYLLSSLTLALYSVIYCVNSAISFNQPNSLQEKNQSNFAGPSQGDQAALFTGICVIVAVSGIFATCLSLLNVVNGGFLTPSINFAYSVYLIWNAFTINNSNCETRCSILSNNKDNSYQWVVFVISAILWIYLVFIGSRIISVFNPQGEGAMMEGYRSLDSTESSAESTTELIIINKQPADLDTTNNSQNLATNNDQNSNSNLSLSLQLLVLALFVCFVSMVLVNWESLFSTQKMNAFWIFIGCAVVFGALYFRALFVLYENNRD